MSYSRAGRGYTKPPAGAQINRGHKLCPDLFCALLNEGIGGAAYDLVQGRKGSITGGQWGAGAKGIVHSDIATSDFTDFGSADFLNKTTVTNAGTVVIGYKKRDTTNRSSGGFGSTAGSTARFGAHLPFSDGTVYWDFGNATGGSGRLSVGGLTFGDDIWVFTGGGRGQEIWQNGSRRAIQATSNAFTNPTGNTFRLGGYAGIASDLADFRFCYIYSTQLSTMDIAAITAEPFAFVLSPPIRRYFVPAPAIGSDQPCFFICM